MKKIRLSKRSKKKPSFAMVDDFDFEFLSKFDWSNMGGYAARLEKGVRIWMHRVIMNLPPFPKRRRDAQYVDHINFDKLDNRKKNLRVCSPQQNACHRRNPNNTSGYRGVTWSKQMKMWQVSIVVNWKSISLGLYKNKKEAAKVYNEAAQKYHGDFAVLNKIK